MATTTPPSSVTDTLPFTKRKNHENAAKATTKNRIFGQSTERIRFSILRRVIELFDAPTPKRKRTTTVGLVRSQLLEHVDALNITDHQAFAIEEIITRGEYLTLKAIDEEPPEEFVEDADAPTGDRKCIACGKMIRHEQFHRGALSSREGCAAHGSICKNCITRVVDATITERKWDELLCPFGDCAGPIHTRFAMQYATGVRRKKMFGDYIKVRHLDEHEKFRYCVNTLCGWGQIHGWDERRPMYKCKECKTEICYIHDEEWQDGDCDCEDRPVKKQRVRPL